MNHAFSTLGLRPPAREATLAVVGLSLPEAFGALAPTTDIATRVQLAERYRGAFRDLNHDPDETDVLFPGAKETIEALATAPGYVLGVATGKSRRGVHRLFTRQDWHRLFSTIQTADDQPSKPHPAMLLAAMRETDIEPRNTVMVGDTTFDIDMARAVGCGAVGVSWGYHDTSELEAAGAHEIISSFHALPGAVERVLRHLSQAAA
jgi:phosphoglycolate phosphatase